MNGKMKKIKIAQIGTAHDHALQNFNSLLRQTEIFDVVGYARVEQEDGFAFEHLKDKEISLDALFSIPDLEAVTIETFDLSLVKYAQAAAEHGVHVFMDKPGSQSCEDFEKMLATLKRKGKVFSIGYMYRFNQGIQEALLEVRQGKFGEVYSVEAQMSCDHTIEKRRWLDKFQGGMTFYLGCHLVDLIYSIQGIPEEIIPYNTSTNAFGVMSNDCGFVVFKYKNGISFFKTSASEVGGFERRQVVISGSLGTVEVKPLEWSFEHGKDQQAGYRSCYKENGNQVSNWWEPAPYKTTQPQNRYDGMFRDFATKIRNGGMQAADFEREARVHRLVLAASGIECDYKGKIEL